MQHMIGVLAYYYSIFGVGSDHWLLIVDSPAFDHWIRIFQYTTMTD